MENTRFEQLGGGVEVCVSCTHTFGSDAILLADFAAPRPKDCCIDLCSGCGIIPLLWLSRGALCAPGASVAAVDILPEAVRQMELSAERSRQSVQGTLMDRFIPTLADLREPVELGHAKFDLVSCNPPYRAVGSGIISEGESDKIARHETMCTLEDICRTAAYLLRFGGRFCLCQLPERLVDVLSLMRSHAVEPKRIQFVQQKSDSPPWLVLVEGKRGAKPFLTVESPIVVEQNAPRYTHPVPSGHPSKGGKFR